MSEAQIEVKVKNLTEEAFRKISEAMKLMEQQATDATKKTSGFISSMTTETDSALDKLKGQLKDMADNALANVSKRLGVTGAELGLMAGAAGIAAGVVYELGSKMWDIVESTVAAGAKLDDMQKITGISVERLSALKYATGVLGEDIGSVTNAVAMMTKRMADGGPEFERGLRALKINFEEFTRLSPDERLLKVSDAMRATTDQTKITTAAMGIFGKQGREMIPLLTEDLSELVSESERLGKVWSKEQVEAADRLEKQINKLHLAIASIKTTVGKELIPGLSLVLDKLDRSKFMDLFTVIGAASVKGGTFGDLFSSLSRIGELQSAMERMKNQKDMELPLEGAMLAAQVASEALEKSLRKLDPGIMSAAQRMISAGMSATDVASRFHEVGIESGYSEKALKQLEDQYKAATEPIQKARDEVAKLTAIWNASQAAGIPLSDTLKEHGKAFMDAETNAQRFGVGVTQALRDASLAARQNDWAQSYLAAVRDMQERFVKSQEAASKKIIDAEKKKNDALREQEANLFLTRVEYDRKNYEMRLTGLDRDLYLLDQEYQREVAKLGQRNATNALLYDQDLDRINIYFNRRRQLIKDANRDWVSAYQAVGQSLNAIGELFNSDIIKNFGNIAGAMGSGLDAGKNLRTTLEGVGNTASKITGVATALGQAAQAMNQATSSGSTWQNVLGGASTGASIGSAFGGWGAAIGAGVGALVGLFRDAGDRVTEAMRSQFLNAYGGYEKLAKMMAQAGLNANTLNGILFKPDTDSFKEATQQLDAILTQWKQRVAEIMSAGEGTGDMAEGFIAPFRKVKEAMEDVTDQGALNDLHRQLADLATGGQGSFERLGLYAMSTFGAILAETGDINQAFSAVGNALDILSEAESQFGLKGSAAIDELLRMRQVQTANKDVMTQLAGLDKIMSGLKNSAVMSANMVNAFGADLSGFYQTLNERLVQSGVDAGAASQQALLMMQPQLQKLWEYGEKFRSSLDDGTRALIEQAETAGIVGPDQRDIQAQMLDVLKEISKVIGDVTKGMRGFRDAAGEAANAVSGINSSWNTWDYVGLGSSGDQPGAINGMVIDPFGTNPGRRTIYYDAEGGVIPEYLGRGGMVVPYTPRGTDTVPAMLTPGEGVLSRRGMSALARLNAGGDLGSPEHLAAMRSDLVGLRSDLQSMLSTLPRLMRDAVLLAH